MLACVLRPSDRDPASVVSALTPNRPATQETPQTDLLSSSGASLVKYPG